MDISGLMFVKNGYKRVRVGGFGQILVKNRDE